MALGYESPGSPIFKMVEETSAGSTRRFGARYGRRVKHRLAEIEKVQKGKHQCPYCRNLKVKRIAAGIWKCGKCGAKFTGKAYSIKKEIILEEEKEE